MKLILTGSTGFIGSEILKQCIAHTFISHVYVLTRKPLDDRFSHKKVTQLLHEDFEQYPEVLMDRLKEEGVEACIWALGGKTSNFSDIETARKVGISYPVQAAEAFSKFIATGLTPYAGYPERGGPPAGVRSFPFRFVFVSGWGAEQDQFRKLWMAADDRKIKGAAEKGIFEVAEHSEVVGGHKCFESIALRPGGVMPIGDSIMTIVTEAVVPSLTVDRLATAAIRCALNGAEGKKVLENKDCIGDGWAQTSALRMD